MKKILLLFLMTITSNLLWADAVEIDGIWYNLLSKTNEAQVTCNANYYSGEIVIPATIIFEGTEYNVTLIGDDAFRNCEDLNSIIISESVKSIGEYAFSACRGLSSITLPNSITSIGFCAFQYCSNLVSVNLSNSLTNISSRAFCGCTSLTSIEIPNSVTIIYSDAFSECSSLVSVVISNSVTQIVWRAFKDCTKLKTLTLGSGIKTIAQNAFSGCIELNDVYCYTLSVPKTDKDAFKDSYIEYATLHVRESMINSFKNASPWSAFKEIVKIDIPVYTLTYMVDGEVYKSYQLEEGLSITAETAPVKEGYSFSGWSEIPETMPAHDVTVTGTFTVNKYKLTYMVDGEEYKTSEVEYGAAITAEDEPTKEGYTFSGWSEIPETMPAKDVVITGTFTINKYKLTYMVDGEEYKTSEVEYGTTIIAEDEPMKEGYTFSGWSEIPETMPAKDVVITGSFAINSYTITYMIDGEVFKTETIEYGSTITPPSAPDREGYTFEWIDVPETMPAKDITIEGSYTSGIGVVYTEEGGDVKWYTIDGKQKETPQKGINIMKKSNGKTRKVLMK